MSDLIERQAAIDVLDVLCQEHRYRIPGKSETYRPYNEAWQDALDRAECAIGKLPSVQPYADEQIQRMQDMEQAQLDKAFELGREDAQEEIIRCKECRWRKDQGGSTAWLPCRALATPDDFYCERAERRTDETD